MTIEEIRALYPHPRIAAVDYHSPARPDEYCVGGALCQAVGMDNHFPNWHRLALALTRLTPTLTPGVALNYAKEIIMANECGLFEDAWQMASQALEGRDL